MTLHPQIAAFAAQLDDLARLLKAQDNRLWADRIALIHCTVADSNFAGVERFLALFEGEGGFASVHLDNAEADSELAACRTAALAMARRLAKEEQPSD